MTKRIAAIVSIFACTSVAWVILGATIFTRTYDTDSRLRDSVVSTWGAPQTQSAPTASYPREVKRTEQRVENNQPVTRVVREQVAVPLPLERSRVRVDIELEHRQKGLLWYSTYKVAFAGTYTFRNDSAGEQAVTFALTFPAEQAVYDDLSIRADGVPVDPVHKSNAVYASSRVPAGQPVTFDLAYRSQGLASWRYAFGEGVAQVRDFELVMNTNFADVDFPDNALSPTESQKTPHGWALAWRYKNLLSGYKIALAVPQKLQPGPLAGQISLFAPVSLFFFFFLLFIITTLKNIELHPMNYFFLAGAFFSFHLLLAYLADHISIHLAFAICSVVSIFLVVSYLRLVVGSRFAFLEAGLAQFVYLVLFSYTFFLEGYTGLSITIGSILTLFIVMQKTGRVRWGEKFSGPTPASG